MSNSLATNSREQLPALSKPVAMSGSLAYHVAGDVVIGGHYAPATGRASAADVAEAQRRLQEAEHLCRPPTDRLIASWCARLRTLPKAPPTDEAIAATLIGIITACSDLPAAVFTAETVKIALQRFKWWPGPAEVYELLSEHAKPFKRSLEGLKRVIAKGAPEEKTAREERTPEAQEHVAALVQAFVQERSSAEDQRPAPKPSYRSKGESIAEYAELAKGDGPFAKMAATRLKALGNRVD